MHRAWIHRLLLALGASAEIELLGARFAFNCQGNSDDLYSLISAY